MSDQDRTPGQADDAVDAVERYFSQLDEAAREAGPGAVGPDAEDLAELRAHVDELIARGHDVTQVLAELGEPADLAAAFATTPGPEDDEDGASDGPTGRRSTGRSTGRRGSRSVHDALHGRVLGVPYDVRPITAARVARRLWDPTDPHVLVPRVWGAGWDLNFGALAVRAGLVRPDDEDSPFEAASDVAVTATLAAPAALAVAYGALVASRRRDLPDLVPTHWGLTGRPDGWSSPATLLAQTGSAVVVPLAAAAWVHARRRPRPQRVAASAAAAAFAALGLGTFAQSTATASGRPAVPAWATPAAFLLLPLALLVAASRAGRAAEQRRDLRKDS